MSTATTHTGEALATRLEPAQALLAALEPELLAVARERDLPAAWEAWADVSAALAAVRAAQGRDARGRGYRPSVPAAGADPATREDEGGAA
jgi:hypothetical protein